VCGGSGHRHVSVNVLDTVPVTAGKNGYIGKPYSFNSTTLGSDETSATVPFNGEFLGGDVTVKVVVQVNGKTLTDTKVHKIKGTQPSSDSIKGEVDRIMSPTVYWFAKRMANQESAYRQFDSQGYPLPNSKGDGGYGIFQITPPNSADQYWNWKANVAKGKSVLDLKRDDPSKGANVFWNSQVQEFNQYNADHPTAPIQPPPSTTEGDFAFAYTPTGYQKSYRDAIWIKQYNGASANYIAWKNTNLSEGELPYWKFNKTNEDGINYVNVICSKPE
jgi:hypothetical protein